jgi:hypothetical protein
VAEDIGLIPDAKCSDSKGKTGLIDRILDFFGLCRKDKIPKMKRQNVDMFQSSTNNFQNTLTENIDWMGIALDYRRCCSFASEKHQQRPSQKNWKMHH